ncbi:MAG: sugar ABC transporter ATP-binding protein [Gaiellales bacterium]|nr:sugar ABC transporter ATP-binding protein [Gaiellales bacterium]
MLLELKGITKYFGAHPALAGVDLCVEAGEIHALVGENGSGKSTLAGIITGSPHIEATGGWQGEMLLAGRRVRPVLPAQALSLGIAFVRQELALIGDLSIARNIALGREPLRVPRLGRWSGVDDRALHEQTEQALQAIGAAVPPDLPVDSLPLGTRHLVEIAREMDRPGLTLLVLDEPTAALSEREAEHLAGVLRALAAKGTAIVYISHRLDEVMALCHRLTVLRDGEVAATGPCADFSKLHVAELMLGHGVEQTLRHTRRPAGGDPALTLRAFSSYLPTECVRDLDVEVPKGQIVGVAGSAGHGRLSIINGLLGLCPARGEVRVGNEAVRPGDVRAAARRGLACVSEDRRSTGLLMDESVAFNIAWPLLMAKGAFLAHRVGGGFLRRQAMLDFVVPYAEQLDIRCRGLDQPVRELSGGNQQKACLARALALQPAALAVAEPTRGIDVGAKRRILSALHDMAQEGVGVLLTSSELSEIATAADQVLVLRSGSVSERLEAPLDMDRLALAVAGVSAEPSIA